MLLLSRLDPHSSKRFRQFFAMLGDCGTTFSGRLIARARSPERERAPPHRAGLLKSLQASASDTESLMINLLDAPPAATPGGIWQQAATGLGEAASSPKLNL